MFTLLNDIYTQLNKNLFTLSVFCDISKAFGCVNYKLVLEKLQFYGIPRLSLEWFKLYLCSRQQVVKVGNSGCKTKNIVVPQGSVLGPVLFVINNIYYLRIRGKL